MFETNYFRESVKNALVKSIQKCGDFFVAESTFQ